MAKKSKRKTNELQGRSRGTSTLKRRLKKKATDLHVIQDEVKNLSASRLSLPDENETLNEVIKKDRNIVGCVNGEVNYLRGSSEFGEQVASIVNYKSHSLASSYFKDTLGLILDTWKDQFGDHTEGGKINFENMSKYFGTETIPFCSLTYDTIPIHLFMDLNQTNEQGEHLLGKETSLIILPQTGNKRNTPMKTKTIEKFNQIKEFDLTQESDIKLETYRQAMEMKNNIKISEANNVKVRFWNFILSDNPETGFAETTFNLFLMSMLISKGYVQFYKDDENILCIKSSNNMEPENENANENNMREEGEGEEGEANLKKNDDKEHTEKQNKTQNKKRKEEERQNNEKKRMLETQERITENTKKNQAILTAWSYDSWLKMVEELNSLKQLYEEQ